MEREIITEKYALYEGDSIEKMKAMPDECVDLITYSPPFADMYTYSGDDRDLSNCRTYEEFLEHYEFMVKETARILKPGRIIAIHCMDIPQNGQKGLIDLPADITRIHKKNGFVYWDKKTIWKDPLMIAIRTRQKALIHGQLVKDSTKCRGVLPDYVLVFKKTGENQVPVTHNFGLTEYFGDIELMNATEKEEYLYLKTLYLNHAEDKTNKLSHFIWKRYASCLWEDIRPNEFVSYKEARDRDDERHLTPTSLDVLKRIVIMYSNKDEVVFSPCGGVGSDAYAAVFLGRKAISCELKTSYFNQKIKNLKQLDIVEINVKEISLF